MKLIFFRTTLTRFDRKNTHFNTNLSSLLTCHVPILQRAPLGQQMVQITKGGRNVKMKKAFRKKEGNSSSSPPPRPLSFHQPFYLFQ